MTDYREITGCPEPGAAVEIRQLAAKVKQLQGVIRTGILKGAWQLAEELAEAKRHIEELEQDRERGLEERGYHIITADQIDAAWEHFAKNKELRPYSRAGAECAMKELGIVACEECGGGVSKAWDNGCPSCHGHGWVSK